MAAKPPRASILSYLYTHNPFYAISAVLLLYAVRASYGTLEIGTINCWIMMGVLAGYTLLLALIGVLIVRFGKVWEDARSVLLILLLMFVAISVTTDDLFVNMTSLAGGTVLSLCGLVFAVGVSEAVLWGTGIRLGLLYRIPFHLMIGLFFLAPWWYAPELHERSTKSQELMLFLFPAVGGLLLLGLIPAIRRGAAYVTKNGTPWSWPWFPWMAFGVIIAVLAFRSFALCMTFGPSGPIWQEVSGVRLIVFDTIWGTYFLVPLVLALLVVLFEAALVSNNRRLLTGIMRSAPALLLLAMPMGRGVAFHGFLYKVVNEVGAPVWVTLWLLIAFYGWAGMRRVQGAGWGMVTMLAVLCVVGPRTINLESMPAPQAGPLFAIGVILLARGWWYRSSATCLAAIVAATSALWIVLPETPLAEFRFTTCYHVVWLAIMTFGLVFRDSFSQLLRPVGAAMIPLTALIIVVSDQADAVPFPWRLMYVVALAVSCLIIAKMWRNRWYWYAFSATTAVAGYASTVMGFRRAVDAIGRPAITAYVWSIGALILAVLISAHKARWLPPRLIPKWANGHRPKPISPVHSAAPDARGWSDDVTP